MNSFLPGTLLIFGGLLAMWLPGRWRGWCALALPPLSLWHAAHYFPEGTVVQWDILGQTLTVVRADRLSWIFCALFHGAALLATLYSLHETQRWPRCAGLCYAGAAIAGLFAGDLLTLFVFWELTAVSSLFLIGSGGDRRSLGTALRYLAVQVVSGLLLMAGAAYQFSDQGSLEFGGLDAVGVVRANAWSAASWLLLLAFGIKAAFPLLHMWLPDAYPQASPGGTVFLSAFTTKLAIYALLRGFAGFEPLIAIGCVMAVFSLFYALVEDDIRRSLAYCLISQLGFMVVAIGIGSELAINGAVAQAVAHVLYKGLLFMSAGAVLHSTGTASASRLGGLAGSLPLTFGCYAVGALATATPALCGFVTKSLTLSAVAKHGQVAVWICLLIATVGMFLVCGLRILHQVFLGETRTAPLAPVPWNMHAAMVVASAGCLLLGLFPRWLYDQLPYAASERPYTLPHIAEQLQLVAAAGLSYIALVRWGWFPAPAPRQLLDADWLYRRGLPDIWHRTVRWLLPFGTAVHARLRYTRAFVFSRFARLMTDEGDRGQFTPTGQLAMAAAVMLIVYLLLYYR